MHFPLQLSHNAFETVLQRPEAAGYTFRPEPGAVDILCRRVAEEDFPHFDSWELHTN
jgi:hypothetical protein